jgi:predicted AAA+ superfamily ATPase
VRETEYFDRLENTYPIHPGLFDALYRTWALIPGFQKARGVLRLMATIIHSLWENGDSSPVIIRLSSMCDSSTNSMRMPHFSRKSPSSEYVRPLNHTLLRVTLLRRRRDMRNITLSIPEEVVDRGREYARRRGISLNALIRESLLREIERNAGDATGALLAAMDATDGHSGGRRWTRDELHER